MRTWTTTGLGAVAAVVLLGAGPVHADEPRTLTGPSTGDGDVFMTYVGCEGLLADAAAPTSRLNLGPYAAAPLGRRSLGLVPAGPGTASGPYASFTSLAASDSSLSVAATSGTRGVSWVVAVTPDSPPGTAWSGRADLSVEPGTWSTVSTAALSYEWSLVDLDTQTRLDGAGSATPAGFAAEHGDGPGFAVTGFGCDAQPFNLDAVRASGATFDFEGVALATTIDVHRDGPRDAEVTVTGRVTDAGGRVTGDPLVLEGRAPGGAWSPLGIEAVVDGDGVATAEVTLTASTELRWHRPESQHADEGWSDPVSVTLEDAPVAGSTSGVEGRG